jgi:large subunit ribosomal protein L5
MIARLQNQYNDDIVGHMMKEFGYSNLMEVPKIDKISVNIGLGDAVQNSKLIDGAVAQLTQITGQHPIVTRARKSIATFKLREGMPIGVKVTLRRNHMYEFLDRLINIALPRVRDFRGISAKAFDGRGNYTLGIKEQIIFPEIDYDNIDRVQGLNVTIVTTAKTDDEARSLLAHFGMPFRK